MDSYFIIYGIFCKVLEGLGTEVPWNPFLQLFSCDIMKKLGVKTAPAYKPVFYHRYMDNTFLTLKKIICKIVPKQLKRQALLHQDFCRKRFI